MDSTNSSRGAGDFLPSIAIVAAFLLFGVAVYFFYSTKRTETRAWGGNDPAQRADWLRETREHEAAQLDSYGWVDRDAGVVRLQIDRAMELTIEELNQDRNEN